VADALNGGTMEANHSTTSIRLPAYTALSIFRQVHPQVALMGTVIYTQWNTFKTLVLNDVAGAISPAPFEVLPSTGIKVSVPENYRNTWNISVGGEYYATDRVTLRGAVGYDQTPVRNAYRNVQLPDNDRYIIALGAHYQISKQVGADVGWTHLFITQSSVNPPPQVTGGQTVATSGHVNGSADVIGAQLTWNIV
jgi:long-chain fatty acid transport protein